jgi:hypothetical protein
MGGLSQMEQMWCHEHRMAQNISHLKKLIFEGFQTHTQKIKLIAETAQDNCSI